MIPRVRSGVRLRPEDFGALVFTNRTPVLAFNHDALAIWELMDGSRSIEGIVEALSPRGGENDVLRTVSEFVRSCRQLGLIETEVVGGNGYAILDDEGD